MKRLATAAIILVGMIYFCGAKTVQAQWPSDPSVNMVLSNLSGEEVLPKVVPALDGGCYISWWDNTSGNYDVYLQRLDGNGVIQWAENGLLISHHPQDTWLTDYDLAVDSAGYAIVAVNDIRNSVNRDIFAYRISPSGEFAWGADGLEVSNGSGFKPDPRVTVTSDGNIVFAWMEDLDINMRKLTSEGIDVWSPAIINLTYTYSLSIPRITPALDDGVILQYLQAQGSGMYAPKYLLAQKYDSSGAAQWPGYGVTVSNAGGFGFQMRPDVVFDGAGGGYSYWYSGATVLHAYAQHFNASGSMLWTANGVQLSTTASQLQMPDPAFVKVPGTGDVIAFYEITNSDQTLSGFGGQKLNSLGARQWGAGGMVFRALGTQVSMLINAVPEDSGAMAIYLETPVGDNVHTYTRALRVNGAGAPMWDPSPINMGATLSEKGHLFATVNNAGQAIAAWEDNNDLKLQNINPDGSFGPIVQPFGTIAGTVIDQSSAPLAGVIDSAFSSTDIFSGIDTTDDSGNYSINLQPDTYRIKFAKSGYRDTVVTGIIVTANQTRTVNMQMFSAAECRYIPGDFNGNGLPNGLDIVFAVNFFRGMPTVATDCHTCCPNTPDPFLAAGDVNGNCAFNGIDITYFVRFLKGQVPALLYCPSCPPNPNSNCPQ